MHIYIWIVIEISWHSWIWLSLMQEQIFNILWMFYLLFTIPVSSFEYLFVACTWTTMNSPRKVIWASPPSTFQILMSCVVLKSFYVLVFHYIYVLVNSSHWLCALFIKKWILWELIVLTCWHSKGLLLVLVLKGMAEVLTTTDLILLFNTLCMDNIWVNL